MTKISLSQNAIYSGNLILVNREYPVFREPCIKSLEPINDRNSDVLTETRVATILQYLISDMNCEETIIATSGFRSKAEQTQIYHSSLAENGADFTTKYVAVPNHSEHQTGLAVDLALNQPDIDQLRPYFPYTGECETFRNKATQFGFIERYPRGKENITGIAHEPWHFRYVGVPHSCIMQEMGLTLEEYLLLLKDYPYGAEPFRYDFDGSVIEINYLPAADDITLFEMEADFPYSVSGDNMNGFIVTKWRSRE